MKPCTKPNFVEDDLDHRHQAVGGAARVGDHVMLGGIVLVVVDAVDDRDVFLLGGRRDDHLLAPAWRWSAAWSRSVNRPVDSSTTSTPSSFQGSLAGSFSRGPSWCRRRRRCRPSGGHTVPAKRPWTESYLSRWARVRGVGDVVDRDEIELLALHLLRGAHHVPPDPAEAVDADLNRHGRLLVKGSVHRELE